MSTGIAVVNVPQYAPALRASRAPAAPPQTGCSPIGVHEMARPGRAKHRRLLQAALHAGPLRWATTEPSLETLLEASHLSRG